MDIHALYKLYQENPVISTDTRTIPEGSIFFALRGEKFNANTFAAQALATGASYVVVDEANYVVDDRCILVDDVLSTLQQLANFHRQQLTIPVIGVTGTNGKTTTKELLYAVLSQKFKTYATKGNLNNHIGVPLTLLAIQDDVEVAIIEMGANHLGEIGFLCSIAEPTCGLITNVGKAHLEGFGSFEGVKKTKGELYDFLKRTDGLLFLQGDNEHLTEMEKQRGINHVVRYGFSSANDIIGKLETANPLLTISWRTHKEGEAALSIVKTNLTGSYNTENILAAVAVGLHFGLTKEEVNVGLESYTPTNNRSQITKTANNVVIADYYNANASSMAAALDNIAVIEASKKAIILGDMFEMGEESFVEHQKVIAKAQSIGVDRLIFVGKAFYEQREVADEFYQTTEEAIEAILRNPVSGCTILLKASRGMAFEKLMEVL
ncbi:UDP-N-acetylmuramoyl-tripeptide--D-alanyl-D-alanine ligase [Sphingobacterium psychroaquaticum]|nr:UDP-N-acetylmuramoyl-tripeptide--D-alanyl-D-alanine ligase [Sphingobacterium psychroaquaticum]QBQ42828.1 UDP-N-acetylmuramoyl-tripeptide--D-alanyl-D-alanine ligase [Sphingobacterium psychroaquaticum]